MGVKEILDGAEEAQRMSVLHWAELGLGGMGPGTQRQWFRMALTNGTKQERPRFGGHERGRPGSPCKQEGPNDLSSSLPVAWQPVSQV